MSETCPMCKSVLDYESEGMKVYVCGTYIGYGSPEIAVSERCMSSPHPEEVFGDATEIED